MHGPIEDPPLGDLALDDRAPDDCLPGEPPAEGTALGFSPVEDPAEDSILVKTARGAGWVIGWRLLTRALGLVSTMFLVRLLAPSDFGLVTLATGFGQAVDALSSLGVEEAVIRTERPSRALYDSAFTINVMRGCGTAAVVALAAWPVALFFNDRRLFGVMLLLAAGALIASFENIGIVDFRREIAFHKEFILMAVPRLVSIALAIGLAYALRSYWALVCAIVTSIAVRVAMGYLMHPFRARFGLAAWREIAGFSFWSWLLSLAGMLKDRAESFVIGRVFDVAEVGVFGLGLEIAAMPTTELISPLSRACFSGFAASRSQGREADMRANFLRVLGMVTMIALPAGVGISLIAGPVVRLAFGPHWDGAAVVVRILGVTLTVAIFGMISGALLNAHGQLRAMLRVQLAALVTKVALLIGLVPRFGLAGAAAATSAAAILENLLYLRIANRVLGLRPREVLGVTWRSAVGAAAMAAGLAATGLGWSAGASRTGALVSQLALAAALGAALHAASVALCWLAAGRPDGAERDLFEAARRFAARLAR